MRLLLPRYSDSLRTCCLCFAWCLATQVHGQLPTAELHALSQTAIQIGATQEITLNGSRLEELSQVTISDYQGRDIAVSTAVRELARQPLCDYADTTNVFSISSKPELTDCLAELRAIGRYGICNPRPILMTHRPVAAPESGHHDLATARTVPVDHLINDRTPPRDVNLYRYSVPAGHRLRCVAYAKQLDSQADLMIRLLDSSGQPLASGRTLGQWPAEINWTTIPAAECYIEVRDLLFRGGDNFAYVLEVSIDAEPTAQTPMLLDTLLRPTLATLQADRFSQPTATAVLSRDWSAAMPLNEAVIDTFPVQFATDLTQTRIVTFRAQKGQSLAFHVESATLDQLTDPALVIYKVNSSSGPNNLQQIAEQDDAPFVGTPAMRLRRIDPHLVWQAPEDATYQLHLIDRQTGARPSDACGCLLEISTAQPDFSLIAYEAFPTNNPATAKPWGSQLMQNGTIQIHVTVVRQDGFNDPIELTVTNLPAGCRAEPIRIAAGASEADIVVQCSDKLDATPAQFIVTGSAIIGDQTLVRQASYATITSAATATHNAIAARASGRLGSILNPQDTAPVLVQLGNGSLVEAKADTKISLPISLTRQATSTAECILRPQSLPPKIGLGEVKIAGDQSQATPEIIIPADAPPGEYTFWMQCETKVKWAANPQALTREEAYVAKLKTALDSNSLGEFTREQLDAALVKALARVEELKKQTAAQEYTVFVPSNPVRLRIHPKE